MKNAKKFDVKMLAIFAIALAAFVAVVFLLPIARNGVFYLAFAVTLVFFGLAAFAYSLSFLHGETLTSRLLGFPIFRVALIALAAQLAAFIVLAAASAVCPMWAAVLVEVLLLAGAAICLIATEAARGAVDTQENAVVDRTQAMKGLRAKAAAIAAVQTDAAVCAAAKKLAEALRFADPVSSAATQPYEAAIGSILSSLDALDAQEKCAQLEKAAQLTAERAAAAKAGK